MFWGLILEPNMRYAQTVEKPFYVSQAALDTSTGDNEPCQVMVVVNGKNFLVCTLQKNKCIQVPLNMYFQAEQSTAFLTNGKCNIHLTGYLDPEFEEDQSGEEEEEEEAPVLVPVNNKRKLDSAKDAKASKKAKPDKKAAVAEESSDDEDDDDDDDEDQLQKFLEGQDISTDENDDSFKFNTSQEATDSDEDDSDAVEEAEDEEEDDDDEDDEDTKNKSSDADTTLNTSKDSDIDVSKLSKSQKRRLNKKLRKQAQEQPKVNGVDKTKEPKQKDKDKKDKKEKKKEAKKEEEAGEASVKKEKKSLSGGVFIEDLKVGTGGVAKPGKTVLVYYEGRLKQNNKMFDSCLKGTGFKFRLGAKEVITGWDIGITGMKIGGKRKIICPPAMAYGAKGSPPVVPPNSTLVFEVELKDIK